MSGQTISSSETKIEALQLQSSAFGVTVPLLFGVNRIAGNLVWYGGFKAVPRTTTQGGKGGGVKTQNTTYTYTASVEMGLCHGPITEVPRIWRGKKLYSGGWLPSQIATASETYTPPGSGAMAYTVAHAATYLSCMWVAAPYTYVVQTEASDRTITDIVYLAPGTDYTVSSAGVLTVLTESLRGLVLTITYQWGSGTRPGTAMDWLGLSFKAGTVGQAAWSGLSAYGIQSIGYSGLALVAGQDYDLGTGAQVENHMFEVVGPLAYHLGSTVPDVDPSLMLRAALTQLQGGANYPTTLLDTWQAWSDYCVAAGLLVSPAITEQTSAADLIRTAAQLTNTGPVWNDGRLKMVPFADSAETGNGRTYTPNTTPVYDLDDNCYTPTGDASPIRVKLKPASDRQNHWRVEFVNRQNQYNVEIAEAKDQADIDANGLRTAATLAAHWICEAPVARRVAQTLLQRSLYVCGEYTVPLPSHYALIEPADLLTLTDTRLAMAQVPVRVTVIEESDDGDLVVTCEDYPAGTCSAAVYPSQAGSGYQADYNAAPGNVAAPAFFEAPAELTSTGVEVYAAVRGAGSNWGGCQVWVSLDGTNYKQAGVVYGGARYGTLSASAAGGATSIAVQGLGSDQLISGSAADATALNTLCYLGGSNPEYLAYQTATLTSAGAYTLASLVHAAYGTAAAAHTSGDAFVRVDERIAKSGSIDPSYVGKTISFKFCSFNLFGGAQQGLADVSAYTYTITGLMATLRPAGGAQTFRQEGTPTGPRVGAIWTKPSTGTQKRWSGSAWEDYATTNRVTYSGTTPASPTDGDLWCDTSTSPAVWKVRISSAWQAAANYTTNTNQLTDGASLGLTAAWASISGSGKAADNATVNRLTYSGTAPVSPVDGDIWVDTSATPAVIKLRTGAVWQTGANLTTNTNQLTDGANLGSTAVWASISGSGKPADNATKNTVTYAATAPVSPTDGDLWCDTSTALAVWKVRISSAWQAAANYTTNTNQLTDGASLGLTAAWASISGSGKPTDNATVNRLTYSGTAPASPVDGDIWVDTSATPAVIKLRTGAVWQTGANLTTNTNQLTDGANLGSTAVWASISGSGKAADNATVGATWDRNIASQPTTLAGINSTEGTKLTGIATGATTGKSLALPLDDWALNGQTIVAIGSAGKVGTTALQLAVGGYPNSIKYMPIDRAKTYRVRWWARPTSTTDGMLYFSLQQFTDAAGTLGPVNGGRSPYKPAGQTRAGHNTQFGGTDQWGEYSYLWGVADWQAGATHVRPEFLNNNAGTAGWWQVQDFTMEEVTEVLAAATTATWGSATISGQPTNSALLNSLQEWTDVQNTGGTRPANNATVNQSDATTNAAIADKLSKSTASVLSATVSMNATAGAGFVAGTLAWNSAGVRTSGAGVAMTPGGIMGHAGGAAPTFSIDTAGNATFAGALSAATGSFAGSLSAATGTLGALTISSGGNIKQGQTAYNTGMGFWLGDASGTPKFSIGNPSGANMRWDGTGLFINTATLESFSASISGTWPNYTATATGGKSGYSYTWVVQSTSGYVNGFPYVSSGITSSACSMGVTPTPVDGTGYGVLIVLVRDSNGRTTTASHSFSFFSSSGTGGGVD